jgi:Zn-dependent peptidase ImmA (M78 family)
MEAMAFGFAAEFLAPWATLQREIPVVPDLSSLNRLRRRWGMSMQAIVMHMHANGAINDALYTRTFRRFSVLGYRRGPEPGWIMPDSSAVHTKLVDVVNEKGLSLPTLAEQNGLSEQLLGEMIPATTTSSLNMDAFL